MDTHSQIDSVNRQRVSDVDELEDLVDNSQQDAEKFKEMQRLSVLISDPISNNLSFQSVLFKMPCQQAKTGQQ